MPTFFDLQKHGVEANLEMLHEADGAEHFQYRDSPHDIFAECAADSPIPDNLTHAASFLQSFAANAFSRWWIAWQLQEGGTSVSTGEEAVIALLQTMTGGGDYETTIDAYCYLFVISRTPLSQTEIAELIKKKFRLKKFTKAAVSKRVNELKKRLGLTPGRGMKSSGACKSYAVRAKEVHQKRKNHPCSHKPSQFQKARMLLNSKPPMTAPPSLAS